MSNEIIVDVDVLEYLPAKTMLKLVEQAQKTKQYNAAFHETVKARSALFRRLEELDIDVTFSLRDGDIDLNFTGDGHRLGEVWSALRHAGYAPNSRPQKGETTFYTHWRQEGLATFWMSFTSSVCRRVQVGTKTVEQPVYEIQCGELPELDIDTTAVTVSEPANDIPF